MNNPMQNFSYARGLLQQWNVSVEDIPTSGVDHKKEADFLCRFGGTRVLIEEKTKTDSHDLLAKRAAALESGEIHFTTLPIVRNERISEIVRYASKQLQSSADLEHDFRLLWFTATGLQAQGNYKQFIATVYGRTNILEMNSSNYRRCYYFRNADFFRRKATIDGAVAACIDGGTIKVKLCLNALSPRYEALKQSEVVRLFGAAVEDPIELEREGTAFILDSDLNRKDESPLLAFLQVKYQTAPLMKFDLGYTNASVLIPKDAPRPVG